MMSLNHFQLGGLVGCFAALKNIIFRKKLERALSDSEPKDLLCRDLEKFDLDEDFSERVWKKIAADLPTKKAVVLKRPRQLSWKLSVVSVGALAVLMCIVMNFEDLQRSFEFISQGPTFFSEVDSGYKDGEAPDLPMLPKMNLRLAAIDKNKFPTAVHQNMKVLLGQPIIFYAEASGALPKKGLPIDLSVTLPNGSEANIVSAYIMTVGQETLKQGEDYVAYTPSIVGRYRFSLVPSQVKDIRGEKGDQYASQFEIEVVLP